MRTVDTNSFEGKTEERRLLRVGKGKRSETTEYDWMVRNDAAVFVLNCFRCDCAGEIDGEEDGVHLSSKRIEGCFEKNCNAN